MKDNNYRGFLSELHSMLLKYSEAWRNAESDPHNIANAVQVSLLEMANAINAVMKVTKDKR